jgi:PAS domain S-box-containing protein
MDESTVQSLADAVVAAADEVPIRILHVDDEPELLKVTKQCLEMHSIKVRTAQSVDAALRALEEESFDAIISDFQMPGKDGLQFLDGLRQRGSRVPFILFAEKGSKDVVVRALSLGVDLFVDKSGNPETVFLELAHGIRRVVARERTEKALKESEETWRGLAEKSPNMIFVNRGDRIVYANEKCVEIAGYTREKLYSPSFDFFELIAPEHRDLMKQNFEKHSEGEEVEPSEYALVTKDCRRVAVVISSKLVKYEGQKAILGVVTDIADRKRFEDALRESEKRFRNIADVAGDWIWELDSEGRYTYSNYAVKNVLGYAPEEVLGKYFYDFFPSEERKKLKDSPLKVFARKERFTTFVRKDGGLVYVETRGIPLLSSEGKTLGYRGSDRDISESRKAEKALQESEQKFKLLFSQNPEATCYTSVDLRILDANPQFEKLFGYTLAEVKGRNIDDVVVQDSKRDEARMLDQKATEGDTHVYCDTERKRKDGSILPVSVSVSQMVIGGRLAGHVVMYKDISETRKAQQGLMKAMEKLRVVGSLMRHDVRNKLAGLNGYAYLLKKKLGDNETALQDLKEMKTCSEQILRILEFSRIYEQLGTEELNYVDVEKCVNNAVMLATNLKNVQVNNECRELSLLADSLLTQVFHNFIDNSLKYGEKISKIRIRYETVGENELNLIYEDNGVGVLDSMRANLFKEGYGKSTGYGLYLIKKICEDYGWTVQETGKTGVGAQFTMNIPRTGKGCQKALYVIDEQSHRP